MMRFLNHRIKDSRILRLLRRFLKAGVMEDGVVSASDEGTPQGGLVSPVLSNIYLHYVLDLWFLKKYAKSCRGQAQLVRYADDFVACFERQQDAERFLQALGERLASFELEVEPTKTRMTAFGRYAQEKAEREARKRPETFSFLGFTHYVTRSRNGKFQVGRRTEGKRIRRKLKEFGRRLRNLRVQGGKAMTGFAQRHLIGHYQYYGVSGNSRSLRGYLFQIGWLLFRWLNRRSQRRSLTWDKFNALLDGGLLPRPRIVHNIYPVPLCLASSGSRMG